MNTDAIIKGYITNLGRYNEGVLSYKLISFPIDNDELNKAFKEIGCLYTDEEGEEHNIKYEEFFFSDWDCTLPFNFGEYVSIDEVNEIAERVEALETYEQDVLKVILEEHTSDVDEALQIVENGDYRIWDGCCSMADVAEALTNEYGYLDSIPEHLQYYIDFEKWGRDLAIEGTFLDGNGLFVEVFN